MPWSISFPNLCPVLFCFGSEFMFGQFEVIIGLSNIQISIDLFLVIHRCFLYFKNCTLLWFQIFSNFPWLFQDPPSLTLKIEYSVRIYAPSNMLFLYRKKKKKYVRNFDINLLLLIFIHDIVCS